MTAKAETKSVFTMYDHCAHKPSRGHLDDQYRLWAEARVPQTGILQLNAMLDRTASVLYCLSHPYCQQRSAWCVQLFTELQAARPTALLTTPAHDGPLSGGKSDGKGPSRMVAIGTSSAATNCGVS